MRITALALNIWDLPVPVPGGKRRLRYERLLAALPTTGADLILLQEAFRPSFRRALVAAMADYHVDAFAASRRRWGPLLLDAAGGLLTFSRWPLVCSEYEPGFRVRGMKPDERIGRKGILWTTVQTPSGPLTLGNVHLYAGSKPMDARIRTAEAHRIVRSPQAANGGPVLLAGDFNIAREFEQPDRGPSAFDVLEGAGFREVADGRTGTLATKDPTRNRWARYVPWHASPRRLTQFFWRGAALRPVGEPRLMFDDPPVSDHFGLLTSFECCSD